MRCTPTGRDFVLRYEVLLEWDADSVSGRDPDSPDTLRAVGVLVGIARGSYVAALCWDLSPTTLKKKHLKNSIAVTRYIRYQRAIQYNRNTLHPLS